MCANVDNTKSMIDITGSSNRGHAICCKTGYSKTPCESNEDQVCSLPTDGESYGVGDSTHTNFKPILTNNLNH